MKHIKLFESFIETPLIEVSVKDTKTDDEGFTSGTYVVDYYTNPSEEQKKSAIGPYDDIDDVITDFTEGDSGGLILSQYGTRSILLDPRISPEMLEIEILKHQENNLNLGINDSLIFRIH